MWENLTKSGKGIAAALGICVALIFVSTFAVRGADDDKSVLAGLISRALSTPATRVSIGSVTGALSSDATVRNIQISDRDGVWLELDQARLIWRRTALLFKRLEIDRLEVGKLTIRRWPIPAEEDVPGADDPILPELPVKLEIKDFSLTELSLGEPIAGVAARLSATGAASLGAPAEGLALRFAARRLDAAGTFTAQLGLVPQTNKLDMTLVLDEPANGIFANAVNVPGRPPVKLDLNGTGTLDDFAAKLAFEAGASIGATGSAQLRREAAVRRLNLDMAAHIEGLLPALAAPVFAGTTQLNGNITFADGGAVDISALSVQSQTARLDLRGGLSADQNVDLRLGVRSVPNAGDKTTAAEAEIRSLVFDASVAGPLMGPRIEATLAASGARFPQGRLDKIDAKLSASPSGAVMDADTSIPFNAELTATGLVPADAALARALGNSMSLVVNGTARDGVADVKVARLRTPTADVNFIGKIGALELDGKATVEANDLALFGDLAGLSLRGALALTAELGGMPREGLIEAKLDGRVRGFASGIKPADGLAGGDVRLGGVARKLPRGFAFDELTLRGVHASARVNGEATQTAANVDLNVTVPDLRRADPQLSGRAEATGKLTGSLERPDATVNIAVSNARALGRPVPSLILDVKASDVTGLIDARANLNGVVDSKPARGTVHAAKRADGGWLIEGLDVAVGSVSVRGDGTLDAARLANGRLRIDARDLDDLSPLAMTKLAGRLQADVGLTVADGGQNGTLNVSGAGLDLAQIKIDQIDGKATVSDLYRKPIVDGQVSADRAVIAGETLSQIRLVAQGTPSASALSLSARGRGIALDARGQLVPAERIRVDLTALNAERGSHRAALAEPATFTLHDGGVDIAKFTLALDSGRLSVDGRAGRTLDLSVNARAVPLAVAEIAVPKLGLSGTLDGEAKISGPADTPSGTFRVRVAKLVAPQTRDFGIAPIDVDARGTLADGLAKVDANLRAAGTGSLKVIGTVPVSTTVRGGMSLDIDGRLDLGRAGGAALASGGRNLSGTATVDLRATGSLTQPRIDGAVTLAGASYSDVALGVKLTGINGRIAARGDQLAIERLTATAGSGTLSVSGQVKVDPDGGFPGSLRITGRNATLLSSDVVTAVANLGLDLSGPLARDPRISGRIDMISMDVTIPERLSPTLRPIPGTKHVAPPPQVRKALSAQARAQARARRSPAFDAALDLTISAPNRIFVRGRGIDAELGGDLRLTGRLSDPATVGAFDLRTGRLSVVGTRLDFTRGRLAFTGDMTPDLDLMAETRAGNITAKVAVNGPASQPTFTFSSDPDLPQDEILSQVLFSKASGSLSPFQALQLAQVAAQFAGGGSDTFERMRKSLGVDSLDISTGTSGDPTVGVRRAINNRISIGVKGGAKPEDSGVTVDVDVTRRLRLQGEATGSGTAVGVGAEWEY